MMTEPRTEMGGVSTGEAVEVQLKTSPLQVGLAVASCMIIFLGGFFVGRVTKDDAPARAAIAGGPDELPANTDEPEPSPAPESPAAATTATIEAGTVEELEAALAAIDLSEIRFVPGSNTLTPPAREVLTQVADVLMEQPFIPVEVEVRTYTEATPGLNHGLSTQQADAILGVLGDQGVSRDRMVAVGLGSPPDPAAARTATVLLETGDLDLTAVLGDAGNQHIGLDADNNLTPSGRGLLDQVASEMEARPEGSVTLVGYAYADSPEASHDRSHAAVDAAAAHLTGRGVDASRLSTVGLGDTQINFGAETEVELEVGFPAAMSLSLREIDVERIEFEPNSDRLTPGGLAVLSEIAAAMALDPAVPVEIAAHTYSESTSQANHDLSHRQGAALVAALVEVGVDSDRLIMVGHGDPPHFAEQGRDSYITFYPIG